MVTDNMKVIPDNNKDQLFQIKLFDLHYNDKLQNLNHKPQYMCKSFTSGAIHKPDVMDRVPTVLPHPKTV